MKISRTALIALALTACAAFLGGCTKQQVQAFGYGVPPAASPTPPAIVPPYLPTPPGQ